MTPKATITGHISVSNGGDASDLYFQAYKVAFDAAQQAERALRFERGDPSSSFIEFSYWDSLKKGLFAGERLLLDLRPSDQYQAGHLVGARQMSGEALLSAGDTLKKHKEKAVVVYDDTGSLGASAVRQLAAQGFKRAVALRGGLAAWRADNLPLSRA